MYGLIIFGAVLCIIVTYIEYTTAALDEQLRAMQQQQKRRRYGG